MSTIDNPRKQHTIAIQDLLRWERDRDLFGIKCSGIPIWRLVRPEVIRKHLVDTGVRAKNNYNEPGLMETLSMLGSALRSLMHVFRLRQYKYLVVGFPRRRFDGDSWVDTFFDPLIEIMGEDDTICLERPFTGRHYKPARTRNIIHYDLIRMITELCGMSLYWIAYLTARAPISELSSAISEKTGIRTGVTRKILARAWIRFRVENAIARMLMAIVRPYTILLINRWNNYALIEAAKRRGIRVYELQHGAINMDSFNFMTEYDPRIDPDGYLTFGDYWNRFEWGVPASGVHAIGHRYIWQRRKSQLETAQSSGDKIILTSRPGRWRELDRSYRNLAERHPDRQFMLKLHPQDIQDWGQRYKVGLLPNVEVIDDPGADLYKLFVQCCAAVGDDSTLLYEAAFFGLRAGFLNEDGSNPSAALEFAGQFNFFEIKSVDDFNTMLEYPVGRASDEGNPFFSTFNEQQFKTLVMDAPNER